MMRAIFVLVVLLAVGAGLLFRKDAPANRGASPEEISSSRKVSCLGKLVPGEKVINLTGPYTVQGPSIVKELLVLRGQLVKKGEILARLHGHDLSQAILRHAEAEVHVAEHVLQQVMEGEKPGVIAAQESLVLKNHAEMLNAESFLRRDKALLDQKAISAADFERSELAWRVSQRNYDQATNTLHSLKEVRGVDIRLAEARLIATRENARRMQLDLEQTLIRSPINGTILEILTYPGEILDRNPILQLGDVDNMRVEAEVYVTDIAHVKTGSKALISGHAIREDIHGTVSEIGMQVDQSSILNPNPSSFTDKRVVKVWIKLNKVPEIVRNLANHQVSVVILP